MNVGFENDTQELFDTGLSEENAQDVKVSDQGFKQAVSGNIPPQTTVTNSLFGALGIPLASINDSFQSQLDDFYLHIKGNRLEEAELLRQRLEEQKGYVKEHALVIKFEIFITHYLYKLRRFSEAQQLLESLTPYFEYFNKELYFYLYLNKGRVAFSLNNYDDSLRNYKLAQQNIISNLNEVASLYYNLAAASAQLYEIASAIDYLEVAYRCFKQLGNTREISRCHLLRGACYSRMGDYAKSEQYYFKTIVMADKIDDDEMKGFALHNLAVLSQKQDKYTKAIDYFTQSVELAKKHKKFELTVKTKFVIAKLFFRLGDMEKAREYVMKGISICSKNEEKVDLQDLKLELTAFLYLLNDQHIQYEETLAEIIRSFSERKDWYKVLEYAELLSGVYMKQQKYEDATGCLKLASDAKRKLGKSERR